MNRRILLMLLVCVSVIASAQPTITGFSPASAKPGDVITITGNNFNLTASSNIISFGAVRSTASAATATSLTVTVPLGATYAQLIVTNNATRLATKSIGYFTPVFSPAKATISDADFKAPIDIPSSTPFINTFYTKKADIDGDGKTDIITNGLNNPFTLISIFRNTSSPGAISFGTRIDLSVLQNENVYYFDVADVNGDGKPDIIINTNPGSFVFFRNTSTAGNISFAARQQIALPSYIAFAIGDLDGDGKPEIVSGDQSSFYVLKNLSSNGNISFGLQTTINIPTSSTQWLTLNDIDADGKLDVIITDYVKLMVCRNTTAAVGNISFASAVVVPGMDTPTDMVTGDIDGDGKVDIVVGNGVAGTFISILRNTSTSGNISFAPAIVDSMTGMFNVWLDMGDLNGDGKPDLTVNTFNNNNYYGLTYLLTNKSTPGNISFVTLNDFLSQPSQVPNQVGFLPVLVADIDGDGIPDITAGKQNTISVYRNIGSPRIASTSPVGNMNTTYGTASVSRSFVVSGLDMQSTILITPPAGFEVSLDDINFSNTVTVGTNGLVANTTVYIRIASTTGAGNYSGNVVLSSTNATNVNVALSNSVVSAKGLTLTGIGISNKVYDGNTTATITGTPVLNGVLGADVVTISGSPVANFNNANIGTAKAVTVSGYTLSGTASGNYSLTQPTGLTANITAKALTITGIQISNKFYDGNTTATITGTPVLNGIVAADVVTASGPPVANFNNANIGTGKPVTVTGYTLSGAASGNYSLTQPTGLTADILLKGPSIISFSPASAKPGDIVTITGSDFNTTAANNVVFFGATKAIVNTASATSLTVTVPTGATYDYITVLNTGTILAAQSLTKFHPVYSPAKTGITTKDFAAKVDFATGSSPQYVAIGDIDGDGKPDLVTPNYLSSTVSILRNISGSGSINSGSFAAKVDFAAGAGAYSVAIGDIDGDGKPDIVIGNYTLGSVSVLRNTSSVGTINSGSFASKVDFSTGYGAQFIAIGDIDGDGKPDIAVVSSTLSIVSVLHNTSSVGNINTGSFDAKVDFATGSSPWSIAMGDVDGDGKPDLVTANYLGNTISVLRNTSSVGGINSSSFASKVDFATGSGPLSVAIGDVDGDTKPDLVTSNLYDNTVSVLHNTSSVGSISSGSFDAKVDFASGNTPVSVAIGDIDGNGKPDLVITNIDDSKVSVLRNTSSVGGITSGSFASRVDFATGITPISVAIGDIDGDGKPELVTANTDANTVSVLQNVYIPLISAAAGISGMNTTYGTASASQSFTVSGTNMQGSILVTPPSGFEVSLDNTSFSGTVTLGGNGTIANTNVYVRITSTTVVGNYSGNIVLSSINASDVNVVIPNSTVTAKGLTITGIGISNKVYDGNTTATITGTPVLNGVLGADVVTISGSPVANFNNANIGTAKAVTVSGYTLSGTASGNYSLTQPTGLAANITAKALTITGIQISNKFYDGNTTATITGTPVLNGIVGADVVTISGPPVANFNNANIGTGKPVTVTGYTLSGAASGNYSLTQPTGLTADILLKGPSIISFSPASAKPGDIVTITGSDFNTTAANNVVFFGATKATVNTASATSLTVTVPTGATYNYITVLNTGTTLAAQSLTKFHPVYSPAKTGITTKDFAAKVDFATARGPEYVAIGDIDGDGKPDLVIANADSDRVSVLRNISGSGSINSGSFAANVDFVTGNVPRSVAIGDIDGDGKPDLVIANYLSSAVSVLRNISGSGSINSGSFAAKVDFTTGNNTLHVTIGDIDGDGKPDIVTSNVGSNTVSVLRNISSVGNINSGSFATKVDFATGGNPSSIAIGDIDGDGKPDLVTANTYGNTISVLRNTSSIGNIGSGSFATKVDFATASNPASIAIGDIDGDGKPDLMTVNYNSDNVSIWRNTSSIGNITSGSFATKVDFATGINPASVAIGDLDGDGKPDLVTANYFGNTVSILRNTSSTGNITSGSFAAKVDFATGRTPETVVIGDIDGDNKPDIATSNTYDNTISVLQNVYIPLISAPAGISGMNTTYGTASASQSFTVSGTNMQGSILVTPPSGFEVSLDNTSFSGTVTLGGNGTIANTNVYVRITSTTVVGNYSGNIVLSSINASDVNVVIPNSIVTAKELTITGIGISNKVYDGNTTATITGTPSLVGVVGTDVVTISGTPVANFNDANVGTGKPVTVTGYTLSGASSGNYSLSQPAGLTADITAKGLTITGIGISNKVYDGNTTATITGTPSLVGVIGADVVTIAGTPVANFNTANVGTAKPVTVTGYTLSGASSGNYSLSQPAGLTADITAKGLTITGIGISNKVYDGNTTATITGTPSLVGVVGADVVTIAGTPIANFNTANVGTAKPVTVTGYTLSGASSGNYILSQPAGLTADITAKGLTITGIGISNKVYDGNTTATITGTPSLVGVVGADVVTIAGTPVANFNTANAGTAKPVTVTGYTLSGASSGNYSLSQPAGLTADITAKGLTITGIGISNKVYDGNTTATITGTPSLVGVVGADVVTISGTPVANFNNANVGAVKPVTVTGYTLSGASSGNYSLSQPGGLTADITAKGLTITGIGISNKVYDGNTTATITGTPSLVGVVGGDVVTISGTPVANFNNANVGTGKPVTVTGYTLSGTSSGNYSLSQPAGLTADITAKGLTITGIGISNKVYDGNTTATITGTPSLVGVVGADVVTIAGTPIANFNTANAGIGKPVTVTGYTLSGASSGNYSLSQPAGLTADITAKGLTITGIGISNKVYDGNTTATITGTPSLVGVVGADVVTISGTPVANFNNANVGAVKPVTYKYHRKWRCR